MLVSVELVSLFVVFSEAIFGNAQELLLFTQELLKEPDEVPAIEFRLAACNARALPTVPKLWLLRLYL